MNAAHTITQPREIIKGLLKAIEDKRGWKYPVPAQRFIDPRLAQEVADAMDFYYGGHEMAEFTYEDGTTMYVVSSRGYYHYVGA